MNRPRTTYTNWNALPLILTTTQAALLLQITPEHLSRMCARGTIPAMRLEQQWRISRDMIRGRLEGTQEAAK